MKNIIYNFKVLNLFLISVFLTVILIGCQSNSGTQSNRTLNLPDSIYSGEQGAFHVQGIAMDQKNGFIYCSFTDKLIKLDTSGHLIGSVTGFVGHLGDLAFDPETNKIYGSLEYKNDAIGKGISKELGLKNSNNINFYIAIFDGAKIVKPKMDANNDNILRTAWLKEVVEDYKARVKIGDSVVEHRFGCSGIDGVTLGPAIGSPKGLHSYLYVAYGIYGDTERNDNNNQVILKYSIDSLNRLSKTLSQSNLHHSGPEKPLAKYFVKTGNTRYGIQNLAYDVNTGNFFAAVYKGTKKQFPNYSLFVINGYKKPGKSKIVSNHKTITVELLPLVQNGLKDAGTGIRGWNFKWGSTGLFSLGNGFFYISHNKETENGEQSTTIYKYKWIGTQEKAFELVK